MMTPHARASLGCHTSQFTPESMDQLMALQKQVNRNTVYLRSWAGGSAKPDVFQRDDRVSPRRDDGH
jgi:hypothetical protein